MRANLEPFRIMFSLICDREFLFLAAFSRLADARAERVGLHDRVLCTAQPLVELFPELVLVEVHPAIIFIRVFFFASLWFFFSFLRMVLILEFIHCLTEF